VDVSAHGLPVDRLPDETLLLGLGSGGAEVELAFIRRFQRTVFGVALAVLGDTALAEDVAQQTFERAWRHAQAYDPRRGSVRAWLTSIARNLAIDVTRVRRPIPLEPERLLHLAAVERDTPEGHMVATETLAELTSALAALPEAQARAVVLAAIHGMTAEQIARFEGIPVGTAKTRIRAAMGKLRAALATKRADHD
jgi:RNA polymerase sigma factor (sigma-70 family)